MFRQQKYVAALFKYNEAIKLDPTFANAFSNRAAALMMLDTVEGWRQAESDCITAMALLGQDKVPVKLHYRLARCQVSLGRLEEAAAVLSQARAHHPLEADNKSLSEVEARMAELRRELDIVARGRATNSPNIVAVALKRIHERKLCRVWPDEWREWEVESLAARKKVTEAAALSR